MRIAVFGANGPTGRHLTRLALHDGHDVVAFTRRSEAFPIDHEQLEVAGGDVRDPDAVVGAVEGADVVLSTLGVPFAKTPVDVYSLGAVNILAAMRCEGSKRFVGVTSSVMGPHPEPLGGLIFEKIVQPYVVNKLGKTVYDDMRRMEEIVAASDLDWTIVRPSGLFEAAEVSDYQVAPDHIGHRYTSRIDLADCLLRQASDTTHSQAAIAVATVDASPSMLKLVWQEGIRKKPQPDRSAGGHGGNPG